MVGLAAHAVAPAAYAGAAPGVWFCVRGRVVLVCATCGTGGLGGGILNETTRRCNASHLVLLDSNVVETVCQGAKLAHRARFDQVRQSGVVFGVFRASHSEPYG